MSEMMAVISREGDRSNTDYFVLDLTHDRHAVIALAAYAEAVGKECPELADDLWCKIFAIRGKAGIEAGKQR